MEGRFSAARNRTSEEPASSIGLLIDRAFDRMDVSPGPVSKETTQ
jgi:hypothetical protein